MSRWLSSPDARPLAEWTCVGLPAALVLTIGSPPLLVILAIGVAIGPVSRPEQLGLGLGLALPLIAVGVLQIADGADRAAPWLVTGLVLAGFVLTRYAITAGRRPRSSRLIEISRHVHGALTVLVLSLGACVVALGEDDTATSELDVSHDVMALAAVALAAIPLLLTSGAPWCRLVQGAVAVALSVVVHEVSFYFLPATLMLAAEALRPAPGRASRTQPPADADGARARWKRRHPGRSPRTDRS